MESHSKVCSRRDNSFLLRRVYGTWSPWLVFYVGFQIISQCSWRNQVSFIKPFMLCTCLAVKTVWKKCESPHGDAILPWVFLPQLSPADIQLHWHWKHTIKPSSLCLLLPKQWAQQVPVGRPLPLWPMLEKKHTT